MNRGLVDVCILILVMGLVHCTRQDQASRMKDFINAKMQQEKISPDQEWKIIDKIDVDSSSTGSMEDDLIDGGLPGQPSGIKFKQYSGHVTIDELKGRSLFYYFAEVAHGDSSSKPLVLWLNGGPGCSSLGVGAMTENGPFRVHNDGRTLYLRRHAWNRVANILFLESPAGVGFSYSNTSSDYDQPSDAKTASDSFIFLIKWFERFSHHKYNEFYLAGESYAGHYIPELADIIIHNNRLGDPSTTIQLKGIMIGNGMIDYRNDQTGIYDYLWSHALVSDETHQGLLDNCIDSDKFVQCTSYSTTANKEMYDISSYDIYQEECQWNSSASRKRHGNVDACERKYVTAYLNLPQVQEAMHANMPQLPYAWSSCSSVIKQWVDSPSTMFPIYERLIAAGLRILLYSGDLDAVIPVTSTRYSIAAMNLTVTIPWRPWLDDSNEVAGIRVDYDGLIFSTIRGAGHEVPRYQPRRALALLKSFLFEL